MKYSLVAILLLVNLYTVNLWSKEIGKNVTKRTIASVLTDFEKYAEVYTLVHPNYVSGFIITKKLPKRHPLALLRVRKNDKVVAVNYNPIYSLATARLTFNLKKVRTATVIRNNKKIILGKKR